MKFKVGDKVMVMDENYSGEIISLIKQVATIETEDGFLLEFPLDQLIKMESYKSDILTSISHVPNKDIETKPKHNKLLKPSKNKSQPVFEVDLHIEKLLPKYRQMNNHEILTYQLDTAQRQLEFAIRKRIQHVVFIHGVGDGVLRTELEYLFKRYDGISFEEASYQKYGQGATQIYIQQNAQRN